MEGSPTLVEAMHKIGATNPNSLKNELTKRGLQHRARTIRDEAKAKAKQEKSGRSDNSSEKQVEDAYYHDDEGGYYIFYFGLARTPKIVPEQKWQRVCWMYPHAGDGRTVAEIATELDIPTSDLRVMLRLYNFDKHQAPYTHEQLKKGDPEELAEESLEAVRKKFHTARQRREKSYTIRELNAAREELEMRKKTLSDLEEAARRVTDSAGAPRPPEARTSQMMATEYAYDGMAPLSDVHGGKFSWGRETWGENYDTRIAGQTVRLHAEAMADFYSSQPGRLRDLYTPDVGDYFNGLDLQTENGTPQEQDGRPLKVWEVMLAAEIAKIELGREIAERVIVPRVPGNHDGIFAQFFHSTLEQRYHDVEDVIIKAHPRHQDAFRIRDSLFVLDHGRGLPANLSTAKAKNDALRVARNVGGEDFYAARYIFFMCGHLHEESRATEDNMRMYRLPAACGQSDFEVKGRYSAEPGARMWTLDSRGRPDLEKPVYFDELLQDNPSTAA